MAVTKIIDDLSTGFDLFFTNAEYLPEKIEVQEFISYSARHRRENENDWIMIPGCSGLGCQKKLTKKLG